MTGKFTRRKLAAALAAPAAAALAQPQTPSVAAVGDELKAARDRIASAAAALATQGLPMATEPAFRFEA